jgi:uncharacterized damage-inducible protein DinB
MDPRYPIGKFHYESAPTAETRKEFLRQIKEAPNHLRAAVKGLTEEQLNTPYRDGGWTVRQVVHHVPESHINAYVRIKLALTEDKPLIKTYDEKLWSETPEVISTPIEISLALLDALHARWMMLWEALSEEDYQRVFTHPDHGERSVEWMLALYAWHSRHHIAHITSLRDRMGW